MRKPLRTTDHQVLIRLLREQRDRRDLTQQAVADRIGTPQSFVAKYEGGERRIDVLEFIALARALEIDPVRLLRTLLKEISTAN